MRKFDDPIPVDLAKLAYEKGFPMIHSTPNKVYDMSYPKRKVVKNSFTNYAHSDYPGRFLPAPNLYRLQKWLRDEHSVQIEINHEGALYQEGEGYSCFAKQSVEEGFVLFFWDIQPSKEPFESYEDALEACSRKVLEILPT